MLKTRLKPAIIRTNTRLKRSLALILSGIALGGLIAAPIVHADTYQQQIDNLNNQNSTAQSALSGLQETATTYQQTITDLQQQISSIESSISANQASEAADNAQIVSDQNQSNFIR
jgi:peptidoglycan hydrolase CwlO-like protein